jgi:hypothetical protein
MYVHCLYACVCMGACPWIQGAFLFAVPHRVRGLYTRVCMCAFPRIQGAFLFAVPHRVADL